MEASSNIKEKSRTWEDPNPKYEGKKKRFGAFRGLRAFFKRKSRQSTAPADPEEGKSRSASELGNRSSGLGAAGLSVSHDSVFNPAVDIQGSASSLHLRAELEARLRRRSGSQGDSTEDLGLPHSPSHHTDTLKDNLGHGDGSLLSMGSSENDEDSGFGHAGSRHSSRVSLHDRRSTDSDVDTEEGTLHHLNHAAARHKMKIRPQRNHRSRRPRRLQQLSGTSLPTTPEVNEDSARSLTPEPNQSDQDSIPSLHSTKGNRKLQHEVKQYQEKKRNPSDKKLKSHGSNSKKEEKKAKKEDSPIEKETKKEEEASFFSRIFGSMRTGKKKEKPEEHDKKTEDEDVKKDIADSPVSEEKKKKATKQEDSAVEEEKKVAMFSYHAKQDMSALAKEFSSRKEEKTPPSKSSEVEIVMQKRIYQRRSANFESSEVAVNLRKSQDSLSKSTRESLTKSSDSIELSSESLKSISSLNKSSTSLSKSSDSLKEVDDSKNSFYGVTLRPTGLLKNESKNATAGPMSLDSSLGNYQVKDELKRATSADVVDVPNAKKRLSVGGRAAMRQRSPPLNEHSQPLLKSKSSHDFTTLQDSLPVGDTTATSQLPDYMKEVAIKPLRKSSSPASLRPFSDAIYPDAKETPVPPVKKPGSESKSPIEPVTPKSKTSRFFEGPIPYGARSGKEPLETTQDFRNVSLNKVEEKSTTSFIFENNLKHEIDKTPIEYSEKTDDAKVSEMQQRKLVEELKTASVTELTNNFENVKQSVNEEEGGPRDKVQLRSSIAVFEKEIELEDKSLIVPSSVRRSSKSVSYHGNSPKEEVRRHSKSLTEDNADVPRKISIEEKKACTDQPVVLRRKSSIKDDDGSQSELMKVFARRSKSLKAHEAEHLEEQLKQMKPISQDIDTTPKSSECKESDLKVVNSLDSSEPPEVSNSDCSEALALCFLSQELQHTGFRNKVGEASVPDWKKIALQKREMRYQRQQEALKDEKKELILEASRMNRQTRVLNMVNNLERLQAT